MRTPEPLRNSPLSQFHKRRSLYNKLYGEGRSDLIRPIYSMPQQRQVSPKGYMSGSSEQYAPHPGFMQISQPGYQDNDGLMMGNMSHLDRQRIIDEIRFAAMELAGNSTEHIPEYEDGLMTEELLLELLESLREQNGEPLLEQFDNNEIATHILAALNQDDEVGMEPDLRENMLEIQMAIEQTRADSLVDPNPEFSVFEQAEHILESQFDEIQQFTENDYEAQMEAELEAQEALFVQPIEEMEFMEDSAPQTLENIVEAELIPHEAGMPSDMMDMSAYDSFAMPQELIDQQMPEASDQMDPMEMEPDPMQAQYDPMMSLEYMVDPHYMPDQMMPGPMPFGHELEPDPTGPMFGPGAGP